MASTPTISMRIALEGGEEIKRQLAEFGDAGEEAFAKLFAAAEEAGGIDKISGEGIEKLKEEFEKLGVSGAESFEKIRDAVSDGLNLEKLAEAFAKVEGPITDGLKRVDDMVNALNPSLQKLFGQLADQAEKVGGLKFIKAEEIEAGLKSIGVTNEKVTKQFKQAWEEAVKVESEAIGKLKEVGSGEGAKETEVAISGLGKAFEDLGKKAGPVGTLLGKALGFDATTVSALKLTVGFGGLVTVLGGVGAALLSAANSAQSFVLKLGDLAASVGVSVNRVDGLRRAFEQAGGSTNDFFKAVEKLKNDADKIQVEKVKSLVDEIKRLRDVAGPGNTFAQQAAAGLQRLRNIAAGFGPDAKAAAAALAEFKKEASATGGIVPRVSQSVQAADKSLLSLAKKVAATSDETERYQLVQDELTFSSQALVAALVELGRNPDTAKLQQAKAINEELKQQAVASALAANQATTAWNELVLTIGKLGIGPAFDQFKAAFFTGLRDGIEQSIAGFARMSLAIQRVRQGLELPPDMSWIDRLLATGIGRILQGLEEAKRSLSQGWDSSAAGQAIQFVINKLKELGIIKDQVAQQPLDASAGKVNELTQAFAAFKRAASPETFDRIVKAVAAIDPSRAQALGDAFTGTARQIIQVNRAAAETLAIVNQQKAAADAVTQATAQQAEATKKLSEAAKTVVVPKLSLEEKEKNLAAPLTAAEKAANVLNEELKNTGRTVDELQRKLENLERLKPGQFFRDERPTGGKIMPMSDVRQEGEEAGAVFKAAFNQGAEQVDTAPDVFGSAEDARLAGSSSGEAFITAFRGELTDAGDAGGAPAEVAAPTGGPFGNLVQQAQQAKAAILAIFSGLGAAITAAISGGGVAAVAAPGADVAAQGAAEEAVAGGGGAFASLVEQARQAVADIQQTFAALGSALQQTFATAFAGLGASIEQAVASIPGVIQQMVSQIESALQQMVQSAAQAAQQIIQQLQQVVQAAQQAAQAVASVGGSGGAPFAAGGYTGSGHRLKPAGTVHAGEYVTPKWIVQKPGALAFLEMWRQTGDLEAVIARFMRGYSIGGLVDGLGARLGSTLALGPVPSFADGGLAPAASGGRPLGTLKLEIGGRSFKVMTDEAVAQALFREAGREQRRSGVKMPSRVGRV